MAETPKRPLAKLTVLLTDQADMALHAAAERRGMTTTDVVNRAIVLFDEVDADLDNGDVVITWGATAITAAAWRAEDGAKKKAKPA